MSQRGLITDPAEMLKFMFAGNATFTLCSKATQERYTFKIRKAKTRDDRPEMFFVMLLSGPDNTSDYVYVGKVQNNTFSLTKASKMKENSTPVKAFKWSYGRMIKGMDLDQLEFWHEDTCGRCGRKLTVPDSIYNGYGAKCFNMLKGR